MNVERTSDCPQVGSGIDGVGQYESEHGRIEYFS